MATTYGYGVTTAANNLGFSSAATGHSVGGQFIGTWWDQPRSPPAAAIAPAAMLDANRTPAPQPVHQSTADVLYGNIIPVSGGRRVVRGRALWWSQPRTITVPSLVSATDGSPNAGQLISTGTAAGSTATVIDIAVSFGAPLAAAGKRGLLKIKAGIGTASTVIYDMTSSPPVNAVGLNFIFYPGSETQLPDPTIEAAKGVGLTQAYRGQMYAVFKDFPIDLFVENGSPVAPLFAALIVDDSFDTVVTETFTITTGSTVRTPAAIDWTSSVAYFSGRDTSYRIIASDLWDNHDERYDVPVVNLSSAFEYLTKQMFFIDGLQLLLAVAAATLVDNTFVLLQPQTGRIVCEANSTITVLADPDNVLGPFTWSIDTSGATPVYLFAVLTAFQGKLKVYRYDPALNTIALLKATANYLDGHAAASTFTVTSIVRGASESGRCVFYISSSANLHKVVVDIDHLSAPFTFTSIFVPAAQINLLHFLPQENAIVAFQSSGAAVKIRCSDSAVLWASSPGFTVDSATATGTEIVSTEGWRRTRPFFGFVLGSGTTGFYLLDLSDGSAEFVAHALPAGARTLTFDSETKTFISSDFGGDPNVYSIGASGSASYALSDIILSLATLCGYADGQVTVTGVDDTVEGIVIDSDTPFLDFLREHQELFNFEVVEGETIRVFRIPENPTPLSPTITPDLCVDTGKDGPITVRDEQETSFAAILEIRYRDAQVDYTYTSQTVQRPLLPIPTTASNRKDTIETPLIMSADQAVTLGTPVIYRRAAGAQKLSLLGLPVLAKYLPGDVVLIESGSNSYTAKIKQTRLAASMQNQITAQVILTESAYTREGSAGTVGPFTLTAPDPASIAILLDGPLLGYRDDLSGLGLAFRWVATSRGQDNWGGAQFFYSLDNVNYSGAPGTAVTSQTVHVGTVLAVLPDNPMPFMTDWTNSFTVVPTSGDFSDFASVTYDQMMSGATLAYIGRPGRWEVIGWETITDNGDGTFTFSGLLRGLYGTEVFAGDHLSGDLFVPITGQDIRKGSFVISTLDDPLYYRGVGVGQSILSALSNSATVSGNAERPPAPAHLDAVISGSDIALSCVKRSRYAQHLTDWNVIESETADEWSFDIMNGSTVLRTLSSSTPSKTYLAADITTDFGSIPASLKFRAYRIGHDNALSVGRGFRAEKTVALS